jgi:hypothetical protein
VEKKNQQMHRQKGVDIANQKNRRLNNEKEATLKSSRVPAKVAQSI